ncbi:MAG: UDP-N-acetylglucosamine 2-epimerase (hydrolyzing) [Muribaculaceae bacterium]|nr:UDP-N-acetylglucosamine 2-epimerase (hydrolyzing) [Muribaculaceae bacterium]
MKIAIATGTRADWGLLSPLAQELSKKRNVEIYILATNMHYLPEYGFTWKEIVADGFKIAADIPTSGTPAEITSQTISGFDNIFKNNTFDCCIILGDRFEMLGVATAAILNKLHIVHIAGGEISEGAFDDSMRHAITKLSTLHLTETEEYRNRVIQMGEEPNRVINTGAIGVHNAINVEIMPLNELEQSINFTLSDKCLLVTLHPATLEKASPTEQMQNLLTALDSIPEYKLLFTLPNNDENSAPMIDLINKYRDNNPQRMCVVPSLGRIRYLSALRYVTAVVGNSSSGLIEVPSAGIPTLNIGIRQQGRTAGKSVIHCGTSVDDIIVGLKNVTSEETRNMARIARNPYAQPDTLKQMCEAILSFPFEKYQYKRFHNL